MDLIGNWGIDYRERNLIWVLVVWSPRLVIVDHKHFQYEGFPCLSIDVFPDNDAIKTHHCIYGHDGVIHPIIGVQSAIASSVHCVKLATTCCHEPTLKF